jgi:hypothetical protein
MEDCAVRSRVLRSVSTNAPFRDFTRNKFPRAFGFSTEELSPASHASPHPITNSPGTGLHLTRWLATGSGIRGWILSIEMTAPAASADGSSVSVLDRTSRMRPRSSTTRPPNASVSFITAVCLRCQQPEGRPQSQRRSLARQLHRPGAGDRCLRSEWPGRAPRLPSGEFDRRPL